MSIHAKRAAIVIAVLLAFTTLRVVSGVTIGRTRTRPEAIWDFLVPSAFACLCFYRQHRRQAKRQSPAPRS